MTAYIVFVTAVPPTGTVLPDPTPVWAVIKEASSASEAVSAVIALGSLPSNDELHASDLSTESTEHFVVTHDVTVNPKSTTPPSEPPSGRHIASVNPNTGPEAGGTEITLSGGGFTNIGGVRFEGGGNTGWAPSFEVIDDSTMTCLTPTGTGVVDVIAFNGDPGDAVLQGGFTYG
jgi:hypothetical protein